MSDRLKFRAFYKDFPLCDDEKGDYTKSFMIYNVSPYGGCNVGTYVEDFEDQLTEQGFTEDEIEQVRDYFSHYEYEDWINFWADYVEQCTGLRDKNGKLIYEGDLVQTDCLDKVFVIVYEENFCGFFSGFVLRRVDDTFDSVTPSFITDSRVIGNIHENEEFKE